MTNPLTPQHDIDELFWLIDGSTISYTRTDEKFGNWHKFGVVDRESLLRELADYCQKREKELLSRDLCPDDLLLEQNKRLIEAGDALYERASYTGRTFDGTHRLLSAAAKWIDVRGKNSGLYLASELSNQQSIETKEK